MSVEEVYSAFVLSDLVLPGELTLRATDLDRLFVGVAMPTNTPLTLPDHPETGTTRFLDRRELGFINIGGPGVVVINGVEDQIGSLDGGYIGKGTQTVAWASNDPAHPATFFFLSCPAHETRTSAAVRRETTRTLPLGTTKEANRRVIRQYIHPDGQGSCQLVMGYTELLEGSVWNTFPRTRTIGGARFISTSILGSASWRIFLASRAPPATSSFMTVTRRSRLHGLFIVAADRGTIASSGAWQVKTRCFVTWTPFRCFRSAERPRQQHDMIAAIKELDAYGHPVVVHSFIS